MALRSRTLCVHLHPETLRRITVASGRQAPALMPFLRAGMFEERGLPLPDITFVANSALDHAQLRFQVNDLTGPAESMLSPGDLLVNETPDRLTQLGISSRPALNPANGQDAAVTGVASQTVLETTGLTVWNDYEYVILSLAAFIREQAGCLLATDVVEKVLTRTRLFSQALVDALREVYSLEELTSLFRQLVTTGLSLRHLPPLLKRLVDIAVDAVPLNEGLIPQLRQAAAPLSTKNATHGLDIVVTYLLPRPFEERLAEVYASWDPGLPPDDLLTAALLNAYLRERAEQRFDGSLLPVLLTSESARPAATEMLRGVRPMPQVISYLDLMPSAVVMPIARLEVGALSP